MRTFAFLLKAQKSHIIFSGLTFISMSVIPNLALAQSNNCHQLFDRQIEVKELIAKEVTSEKPNALKESLKKNDNWDLENTLYTGYAIEYKKFSANNNRNPIWKLKIKNPKTNQVITALLKPRPFGDGNGWNRTTMEYVGYRVSQLLNMDYIAPVAYRKRFVFGDQFIHEGSLQLFVEKAKSLHQVPVQEWPMDQDIFLSDARVLDVLLQNPDRHKDNFMMGQHWISGKPTLLLIDQAACLKPGTDLKLNSPGWKLNGPITQFKRSTYNGLLSLNEKKLSQMKEFLSDKEIQQILSRRDSLVSQINELIKLNGESAVLIER